MSDVITRRLNLNGNVMALAQFMIPDNPNVEPRWVEMSRELLLGFLLHHVDSLNHSDAIGTILKNIEQSACVQKDIQTTIARSLEVQFFIPQEIKAGYFYLAFDKKADQINYAVMRGKICYRGEITDDDYIPLKQKLRITGTLSLKEVNFLIKKVVKKRKHLQRQLNVEDAKCRQYFSRFLALDAKTQTTVLALLLTHLKPFEDFKITEPGTSYRHVGGVLPLEFDEMENIIRMLRLEKDYNESCYQEAMSDQNYQNQEEGDEP